MNISEYEKFINKLEKLAWPHDLQDRLICYVDDAIAMLSEVYTLARKETLEELKSRIKYKTKISLDKLLKELK